MHVKNHICKTAAKLVKAIPDYDLHDHVYDTINIQSEASNEFAQ